MKIREYLISRMSIQEFADKNDLTLEIHERGIYDTGRRYYVYFEHTEISEEGRAMLISAHGNGSTGEEAIEDYAKEISKKYLVVDAHTLDRREIRIPKLFYDKERGLK